jgi:triacylglycerol lipase
MNLVFASGVLVPQKLGGLAYFRDLPNKYPDALFAPVDTIGSVTERAQKLAAAMAAKFPTGDIHIVAHSMGGLDSRYLLAKNLHDLARRVMSLSTISTPHGGSPLADLLTGQAGPLGFLGTKVVNLLSAELPALKNRAGGFLDLTTKAALRFNADNPPVAGVSYYPYAATAVSGHRSTLLLPAHFYIRLAGTTPEEQENDGVVSLQSAAWPHALVEAPWDTDHFGQIGYDLDAKDWKTPFDYLDAYARVIQRAGGSPARAGV